MQRNRVRKKRITQVQSSRKVRSAQGGGGKANSARRPSSLGRSSLSSQKKGRVTLQGLQSEAQRHRKQPVRKNKQQAPTAKNPLLLKKQTAVGRKTLKPSPARSRPAPAAPLRNRLYRLSVIIPAMNEAEAIGEVLREVRRLQPNEVVVVVNGSTDATSEIARSLGAKVIEFAQPLGNDVGRAVGVLHTDADIYLFIDGDFAVKADVLSKLIRAVETGTDVALNSLFWLERYPRPDIPSMDRYFLNMLAGRSDLGLENLLTIPHALSSKAVNAIGLSTFANPLLATAVGMDKGLKITCPTSLDVLAKNKFRPNHKRQRGEKMSSAFQRMHGDTVEAVRYWLDLHPPTENPLLSVWESEGFGRETGSFQASSASHSISAVLWLSSEVNEHIWTAQELAQKGVQIVLVTPEKVSSALELSQDSLLQTMELVQLTTPGCYPLAFAAGAMKAKGDCVVFHDLSVPILAEQLLEFAEKVHQNTADVVVANQVPYPVSLQKLSPVSLGNWFANVTEGQDGLKTSGMMLPPFSLRKSVLAAITPKALLNPSLAQAKAAMSGFRIETGPSINTLDLYDESERSSNFSFSQIRQQFSETLDYWTGQKGRRGGFTDEGRKRSVLPAMPPRYYTDVTV